MAAPPAEAHVHVSVRVRPSEGPVCVDVDQGRGTVLLARSAHGAARQYTFDDLFDEHATNAQLYARVGQPLLDSALDGYNATLLTYGQTGAGKTYTVMGEGSGDDPGVVTRLVSELFEVAGQQGKRVQFSMLEIYNEQIRDLFSVTRKSLRIREDPRTGPFVEDLSWFVADDLKAMQQLLAIGTEARTVRSTHNNQHSSRAHTVVQITINSPGVLPGYPPSTTSICLVDLAGSERQDPIGFVPSAAVGSKALREGCAINQSLSNLGLCISALVAGGHARGSAKHVPYRNSALTWLLRESLGGNSKTCILACINPAARHREESLSTLRFADRAKQLTMHVNRHGHCLQRGGLRMVKAGELVRGGTAGSLGGVGGSPTALLLQVGTDPHATIIALREEVRRLQATIVDLKTEAVPVPPATAGPDTRDRAGSEAEIQARGQGGSEEGLAHTDAVTEPSLLGMDESMLSFLAMEEMAEQRKKRQHTTSSSTNDAEDGRITTAPGPHAVRELQQLHKQQEEVRRQERSQRPKQRHAADERARTVVTDRTATSASRRSIRARKKLSPPPPPSACGSRGSNLRSAAPFVLFGLGSLTSTVVFPYAPEDSGREEEPAATTPTASTAAVSMLAPLVELVSRQWEWYWLQLESLPLLLTFVCIAMVTLRVLSGASIEPSAEQPAPAATKIGRRMRVIGRGERAHPRGGGGRGGASIGSTGSTGSHKAGRASRVTMAQRRWVAQPATTARQPGGSCVTSEPQPQPPQQPPPQPPPQQQQQEEEDGEEPSQQPSAPPAPSHTAPPSTACAVLGDISNQRLLFSQQEGESLSRARNSTEHSSRKKSLNAKRTGSASSLVGGWREACTDTGSA